MKASSQKPSRIFSMVIALAVVFCLTTPTALAGQSLMAELPGGHDTVVVIDFKQMRGSPLFDQAMQMVEGQPGATDLLRQVQSEMGVDLRTDLDALAMSSDSPPLSQNILSGPAGALQEATTARSSRGLVLLRGTFDANSILAHLAEAEEAPEVVRHSGMELRAIDGNTLAVAFGPRSYLDNVAGRLSGAGSGPGGIYGRAVQKLGGSQSVYMMIAPSVQAELEQQMGAVASFAAISLNLSAENVRIGALLDMDDADDAAKMIAEVDGVRQETVSNPLVAMLGIRAVLENLSLQQDGSEVLIRTSMTNRQAIRLIRQGTMLATRGQQLQQPLQGRGLGDPPSEETEVSEEEEVEESSEPPQPSPDGVDAAFN